MSKRSEKHNYPCQYSDHELNTPSFRDKSPYKSTREDSKFCFIATVVYGDINAREVHVLRDFRDKVLRESRIGRAAIDLYYGGLGERTANLIKDRAPSLIPVIKKGLDYIVDMCSPR